MKILYSKTSIKYLQKLERNAVRRIVEAIERLSLEGDVKRLKGKKIKNVFRLRIGKHRIIYTREEDVVRVIKIDTRGDIYK